MSFFSAMCLCELIVTKAFPPSLFSKTRAGSDTQPAHGLECCAKHFSKIIKITQIYADNFVVNLKFS